MISRLDFSQQFLARCEVDSKWPWIILSTDEAHFYFDLKYLELPNLRTRKFMFNLAVVSEKNGLVLEVQKRVRSLDSYMHRHQRIKFFHNFKPVSVFYARFFMQDGFSTHQPLCHGCPENALQRRTSHQSPLC